MGRKRHRRAGLRKANRKLADAYQQAGLVKLESELARNVPNVSIETAASPQEFQTLVDGWFGYCKGGLR